MTKFPYCPPKDFGSETGTSTIDGRSFPIIFLMIYSLWRPDPFPTLSHKTTDALWQGAVHDLEGMAILYNYFLEVGYPHFFWRQRRFPTLRFLPADT